MIKRNPFIDDNGRNGWLAPANSFQNFVSHQAFPASNVDHAPVKRTRRKFGFDFFQNPDGKVTKNASFLLCDDFDEYFFIHHLLNPWSLDSMASGAPGFKR